MDFTRYFEWYSYTAMDCHDYKSKQWTEKTLSKQWTAMTISKQWTAMNISQCNGLFPFVMKLSASLEYTAMDFQDYK